MYVPCATLFHLYTNVRTVPLSLIFHYVHATLCCYTLWFLPVPSIPSSFFFKTVVPLSLSFPLSVMPFLFCCLVESLTFFKIQLKCCFLGSPPDQLVFASSVILQTFLVVCIISPTIVSFGKQVLTVLFPVTL